MAFTIDFNTSNAATKVDTLAASVDRISHSATKASLSLEKAFSTPKSQKELVNSLQPVDQMLRTVNASLKKLDVEPLNRLYRTLGKKPASMSELGNLSKSLSTLATQLPKLKTGQLDKLYDTLSQSPKSIRELQSLGTSLTTLSKSLPKIDSKNLRSLYTVLSQDLSGKTSDLGKLSRSIESLSTTLPKLDPKQLGAVATGLQPLTQSVSSLSGAISGLNVTPIQNLYKILKEKPSSGKELNELGESLKNLSAQLPKINTTNLDKLYKTLSNAPKSVKELSSLSESIGKLSRQLPKIDSTHLQALYTVISKNIKTKTGDISSLARSVSVLSNALPTLKPQPLANLITTLDKYKPIGADFEKLGRGIRNVGVNTETINAQKMAQLITVLGQYKSGIGTDLNNLGSGIKKVNEHLPNIKPKPLKELMAAVKGKFDGDGFRSIASGIAKIAGVTEKLDYRPVKKLFDEIRKVPRNTTQINNLAEALKNLAKAQQSANTQAMRSVVQNAMAGQTDAAKIMGISAAQLKMIQSVGEKQRAIAEGKQIIAKASGKATGKVDGFSGALGRMSKQLKVGDQQSAALRASMNALGTHMGIFTGQTIVVATAVYSTISAFRQMVTVGNDFSREMIRATAVIGATPTEYTKLEQKVRDLAKTTIYTGREVAEGLRYLGMAGLSSSEAIDALEPTLNIAKIGMIEFAESADIVTNVLRAFKLNANELGDVADDLATAITNSNATIKELAKALSYVAPIAYAAGGSLREVNSLLAVMHDVGIKSSRAGTALRRAYGNLLAPTDKVRNTLQELGITTHDANGRMRSMVQIFHDMAKAGAAPSHIMKLFGVRASSALQSVLDDVNSLNPKLNEMYKLLGENQGAARDLGATIEDYLGADARKLVSALEDKFIEIFNANKNGFRQIIADVTEFIKSLDAQAIGKFAEDVLKVGSYLFEISGYLAAIAGIVLARSLFGVMAGSVLDLGRLFVNMGKAIFKVLGYMRAFVVLAGAKTFAEIASAAMTYVKAIRTLNKAIIVTTVSQKLFNAAALKNKWLAMAAVLVEVAAVIGIVSYGMDYYNKITEDSIDIKEREIEKQKELVEQLDQEKLIRERLAKFAPQDLPKEGKTPYKYFGTEASNLMGEGVQNFESDEVYRRMNTLYAKRQADLNTAKAQLERGLADTERLFLHAVQNNMPTFIVETYAEKIREGLAGLEAYKQEMLKLDKQLEAAYTGKYLPSDIPVRNAYQDEITAIYNKPDYERSAKEIEQAADVAKARVTALAEIGTISDQTAYVQLSKIESGRVAQLIANKQKELKVAQDALTKLEDQAGIKNRQTGEMDYHFDPATGTKVSDPLEQIDTSKIDDAKANVNALTQSIADLRHQYGMTEEKMRNDNIARIISEADFDKAIDSTKEFIKGSDAATDKLNAEVTALKTGENAINSYVTAKDREFQAEINGAIAKQKAAIDELDGVKGTEKTVAVLKEKLAVLQQLQGTAAISITNRGELEKEKDELTKLQERRDELKDLEFVPDDQKARMGYGDHKQDVYDYFLLVRDMEADQIEGHADYIAAMQALDEEYFDSIYPRWSELFDGISSQMSDAISQVVVYGESWNDIADGVRKNVYDLILRSLVDVGIEYAKQGMVALFVGKQKAAANQLEAASEVSKNTIIAGSIAARVTTTTAAEDAAALKSQATAKGVIAGVTADAAAAASAWSPAAVNAATATFGGAVATGSAALAAAHAANLAMSTASSTAASVVGGAVTGRANGGRVEAGRPYLVGEESAEVFVPDRAGTIINERQNKQKGSPFGGKDDGGSDQKPQDIKIINAIDPAFIKDYLASSEGEQIIINHIQRNKGSF